ncbi:hypothetical protein [Pectinatus brassicae]|uniref:L-rhamnose mutarotase n=1 Tax=Pectinatus brassicae TaxID=862415 RepID=A0A840UGH5_9FIRM|nr:hypothetical protein [Pectinatus brassicae]MBB5335290.1 L-rhamnose mutarotase [Pectinatus brassicae]
MNRQIKKIILLLVIFINVMTAAAAAQNIAEQEAARKTYEQALSSMDKISAQYDMKLQVSNVLGSIYIRNIMKCQSSPLLMKSDIKASMSLLGKAEQPLFSMMQYSEINNNAIETYSSTIDKDGKYNKWIMNRTKIPEDVTAYLDDVAAPDEKQYTKTKKIMEAAKEISVISEDENIEQLKVVFSSKKIFSYANMVDAKAMLQNIPNEEKDFVWNMMTVIQPELQNSGDIEAHLTIDKTTKSIISADFNITPQLKVLTQLITDFLAKTDTVDKNAKNNIAGDATGADISVLTSSLQGHISLTIKPINDVMELAIPQHVRQTAVTVKEPVNKNSILNK